MEPINNKQKLGAEDYSRLTHAAGVLTSQACTVSARHIQDGMLRIKFNREVAYYAQAIVRDVTEGRKSVEWGLKELKKESKSIAIKWLEFGRKGVGVLAGITQVAGGVGRCGSIFTCPVGIISIAHGTNNVIENSVNLWTGNSEMQGPVRSVYRYYGKKYGGSESSGDKAYAFVDLGLSGWGMLRTVPRIGAWKLFKTMPADLIRSYKQMSKPSLFLEGLSDAITLKQLTEMDD
jgi:Protein of unknown function (DUF4225)